MIVSRYCRKYICTQSIYNLEKYKIYLFIDTADFISNKNYFRAFSSERAYVNTYDQDRDLIATFTLFTFDSKTTKHIISSQVIEIAIKDLIFAINNEILIPVKDSYETINMTKY